MQLPAFVEQCNNKKDIRVFNLFIENFMKLSFSAGKPWYPYTTLVILFCSFLVLTALDIF